MEVFAAIIVVVPLLVPLGEAFGIHPVHLGILFIANLELGYLTPPAGLNLFLASYALPAAAARGLPRGACRSSCSAPSACC